MRKTGHRNGEKQSFLVAVRGPPGSLSHTFPKPALQTSGTTPRILAVTGETSRSQCLTLCLGQACGLDAEGCL